MRVLSGWAMKAVPSNTPPNYFSSYFPADFYCQTIIICGTVMTCCVRIFLCLKSGFMGAAGKGR